MPPARTQPDSGLGKDGTSAGTSSSSGFRSPVNVDGSGVQQTGGTEDKGQAVPITPPGRKVGPNAPTIPDDKDGNGAGHLPTLNLDGKVASRAAPERKRITLKANVSQARLIRVPAYPKSDWVPVDTDAKVAKK